jgi:hypothetical protein
MAYSRASVTAKVAAPADKVWELVGSFANLKAITSGVVASCDLDKTGTIRKLKVKGAKGMIVERLVKYDSQTMTQVYCIVDKPNNIVPFVNYTSTIKVKKATARSCSIIWSSRFEPKKGQTVAGCQEFARGVYETGIAGVQQKLGLNKPKKKAAAKAKPKAKAKAKPKAKAKAKAKPKAKAKAKPKTKAKAKPKAAVKAKAKSKAKAKPKTNAKAKPKAKARARKK